MIPGNSVECGFCHSIIKTRYKVDKYLKHCRCGATGVIHKNYSAVWFSRWEVPTLLNH